MKLRLEILLLHLSQGVVENSCLISHRLVSRTFVARVCSNKLTHENSILVRVYYARADGQTARLCHLWTRTTIHWLRCQNVVSRIICVDFICNTWNRLISIVYTYYKRRTICRSYQVKKWQISSNDLTLL